MKVAIISCFDVYRDRLRMLKRFFTERGDNVTVLMSDFCHAEKISVDKNEDGFELIHAMPYQKNLSVARICSHVRFAEAVRNRLEKEQWDVLWVLIPANSLVKECAQYKKNHPGTKLIVDVNDLWPESMPIPFGKSLPPFQIWKQIRDKNLPTADYVVTECELFRQRLELEKLNLPHKVIYLCKEWNPVPNPMIGDPRSAETISLCYLGSINNIIDIDAICGVIRTLTKKKKVCFHIIGTGESKELLISSAESAGADVFDHGIIYDEIEKQKIFDVCHFGFNAMKSSVCVGLTMKSLDYLAGGLPLINTIHGDTWDTVTRLHCGINVDEPYTLNLEEIDYSKMREVSREFYIQKLSYPAFSGRVVEVLSEIRNGHSS